MLSWHIGFTLPEHSPVNHNNAVIGNVKPFASALRSSPIIVPGGTSHRLSRITFLSLDPAPISHPGRANTPSNVHPLSTRTLENKSELESSEFTITQPPLTIDESIRRISPPPLNKAGGSCGWCVTVDQSGS